MSSVNSIWRPSPINVSIEENGEYILLEKVPLRGKLYDIRVERRNAEGKTLLDPSKRLTVPDVMQIQRICTETLFHTVDPAQWYFEYKNKPATCLQKSYTHLDPISISANEPIFEEMKRIDQLFGRARTTSAEMFFPKQISLNPQLPAQEGTRISVGESAPISHLSSDSESDE